MLVSFFTRPWEQCSGALILKRLTFMLSKDIFLLWMATFLSGLIVVYLFVCARYTYKEVL